MANNTEYFYNGISVEPISADPANPREGQVQFSDGTVRTKGLWQYKDSDWAAIGGSAGSLDIIYQADFNTDVDTSAFTTGNDAVFDNGGTVDGAIALESSSPISGAKSFKYTMSSSSTNDFIKSESITLDSKQKGQYVGISFYYTYDGDDDDITFIAYDDTNNEVLTDSLDLIKAQANPTRYSTSIYVPTDCSILNYGFQVGTGNNTKILTIDDVELTTNPFVYKDIIITQHHRSNGQVNEGQVRTRVAHFDTGFGVDTEGDSLFTVTNTVNEGVEITFLRDCYADITFGVNDGGSTVTPFVTKNISGGEFTSSPTTSHPDKILAAAGGISGTAPGESASSENFFRAGDKVYPQISSVIVTPTSRNYLSISARATTEHVITPANVGDVGAIQAFGTTDTPSGFIYCDGSAVSRTNYSKLFDTIGTNYGTGDGSTTFNLPDLRGLFLRGQDDGSGNDPDDASRTVNNTGGNTGDNVGSEQTDQYKNHSHTQTGYSSPLAGGNRTVLGSSVGGQVTSHNSTLTSGGNETRPKNVYVRYYIRYRTSTTTAAIPTQLTAYVKDLKAPGSVGGSSSTNTIQTRDLNTLSGDVSFLTLNTNQITLSPGKYTIEWSCPVFDSDAHQSFLYNVTSSTYDIDGSSGYETTQQAINHTFGVGGIEITSSTDYEIRHWTQTAKASNGLGVTAISGANPSSNEIYTQVKITKVK